MLFHTAMSAEEITSWISSVADDEESHPLPNPSWLTWDCDLEEAKRIKVTLVDLGQGVPCSFVTRLVALIDCGWLFSTVHGPNSHCRPVFSILS